ncbi:MAG TPA: general stress protein CsbD [Thermoanaerobaculia bacterium]|nr:general stress protein CsbD [Thermoanaerobaculia bacterium]
MNWEQMEVDWQRVGGDLRTRWSALTDEDLEGIAGKRERLLGRLREIYGLTEKGAEAELRDWERHQEPIELDRMPES